MTRIRVLLERWQYNIATITELIAETAVACSIIACGDAAEEEPPPLLMTDEYMYERFGIIPDYAPYIDEQTAEYSRKINELRKENERLIAENEKLRHSVGNSDESSSKGEAKSLGEFEATFYTAFCPTGCIGVTATGIDVSNTIYHEGKRIIAVDPSVIPLGTHVKVILENGDSFEATAQDTGGDIKGGRIDILVESREEAYRLGRQSAKVEAIE